MTRRARRRDGCEWWTPARTAVLRSAFAERLTRATAPPDIILHSSWCSTSRDGRRRCTCVPVTLVFGATS
jgi:hypothetical protein